MTIWKFYCPTCEDFTSNYGRNHLGGYTACREGKYTRMELREVAK